MFRQKRSRDDGPRAARSKQASDCDEKVYEKKNEITHFEDTVTPCNGDKKPWQSLKFCPKWEFAPHRLMKPPEYVNFWMRGGSSQLDRVASIYGAQGFESDYVGIIWGRDLVVRDGRWALGDPEVCFDRIDGLISKRGAHRWSDEAQTLVKNRYRIFLTRGILGTVVHFEDAETGAWFNQK